MLVKDVMTRSIESIEPGDSIQMAAQRMRESDIGLLPVWFDSKLMGVITDRDIVVRVVATSDSAELTTVESAMSPDAISCLEDETVEAAAMLMRKHLIRRVVVLNSANQLAGVISLADFANQRVDANLIKTTIESIFQPIHALFDHQTPESQCNQRVVSGTASQVPRAGSS